MTPPERAMAAEFVRTRAPTKVTSLTMPAGVVPRLVIVVVPLTVTASASEDPISVVEALAIEADELALVERTMACTALR